MNHPDSVLGRIQSPADLKDLSEAELEQLAAEMRSELIGVVGRRSAHFASNLGVVELCLALHLSFDFTQDRLIWDTGHQIYPHKLITGRAARLHTIRTKGGLMGYPNPAESPFDLFMTGHAGCSPSTALGLKVGDEIAGAPDRHAVAVIGDGALPSGIVFEAFNHASGLRKKLLVILNDNKMSICPRVGGLADYLDRARMSSTYNDWNKRVKSLLPNIPLVGEHAERWLQQFKDAIKASLHHGMLFEELGFVYLGPIDGHDLKTLRGYLERVKALDGPVLLHILTNKGHGFEPAVKDPVKFHAPAPFQKAGNGVVPLKTSSSRAYTDAVSDTLFEACRRDPKVAVITAAMCEGNKLQKIRDTFPGQFFDVGICESHAVAFAAGMAKAGARPVVDIYSTFLQRSYDQIFQEVALQNLPVVFCLDRAGLVGADGPTHHGIVRPGLSASLPQSWSSWRRATRRTSRRCSTSPCGIRRRWPCATHGPTSRPSSVRSSPSSWARPRFSSGRPTACSWPAARWSEAACVRPSGWSSGTACGSAWSTPGSSSRWIRSRSARRSRSADSS